MSRICSTQWNTEKYVCSQAFGQTGTNLAVNECNITLDLKKQCECLDWLNLATNRAW